MVRVLFSNKVLATLHGIVRYLVATILIFYAGPKLLGKQFQLMNHVGELPLNKIDSFSLAWAFFGYSYYYQLVIALGELTCGFLLCFRRTTTLGALGAFPITANILLVDFAFDVNAKEVASLLMIGVVFLLAFDFQKLKLFFWDQQSKSSRAWGPIASALYAAAILSFSIGLIVYLVNSNRNDTDGVYQIESYSVNGAAQSLTAGENYREPRLFIDFNGRSYLSLNGRDTRGRFTFNSSHHEFTWTKDWKTPEAKLKGTYRVGASALMLEGTEGADTVIMALKRLR